MDERNIGRLIRNKRMEKGLSQRQLAEHIHVSAAAVNKWEKGTNFLDMEKAELLSDALDIPLPELLREDDVEAALKVAFHLKEGDTADTAEPAEQPAEPDEQPEKPADTKSPASELATRWIIAILLMCAVLAGGAVTVRYLQVEDEKSAFTICREYYGEYEGQKAYYICIEYSGNPTAEDIVAYDEKMQQSYWNCFEEADLIIIAYFEEYTETASIEVADYLSRLYPLAPQLYDDAQESTAPY